MPDSAHTPRAIFVSHASADDDAINGAAPLAYAMTQANLGLVQRDLGGLAAAIALWQIAEWFFR